MRQLLLTVVALCATASPLWSEAAVSLRGSPESMVRQNRIATEEGYAFAQTLLELRELEEQGNLVRLEGNQDYALAGIRNPVARPEISTFLERVSAQYRSACGEKLVVTSLTRPAANQPRNSHPLSIHPTGLAVDLRVSQKAACRSWLESTLLSLERRGLLDVTREYRPPHYHVALFPAPYMEHVARLVGNIPELPEATTSAVAPPAAAEEGVVQPAAPVLSSATGGVPARGGRRVLLAMAPATVLGLLVLRRGSAQREG